LNIVWVGVNDTSGAVNNSEHIAFTVDTIAPNITIHSPTATTYTSASTIFNLTLDETGSCMYSLDAGITNNSMLSADNKNFYKIATLSDAVYTVNYYCNDSAGNKNNTESVSFTVDVPDAVTPSTGGGGGGSSASLPPVEFSLDEEEYEITLSTEESGRKVIGINNDGNVKKTFSLKVSCIREDIIVLKENEITLESGEAGKIEFNVFAPDEPGLYTGKIIVTSGSTQKNILFSINVKSDKSLFDVYLTIPLALKQIKPGENFEAQIDLLQAGIKEKMDVTLNYLIKDFEGNVYIAESESIMVYDQKSVTREFVSENLDVGDYVLGVEVIYPGGVAVASSHFLIKEPFSLTKNQYILVGLIVAVLVAFIVMEVIIKRYKKRKDIKK